MNRNSVENDSGCHSVWQAMEVTLHSEGQRKALFIDQNGWGWKKPLEIMQSNLSSSKSRINKTGWSRFSLCMFCLSLRMETPQFLWKVCSSVQSITVILSSSSVYKQSPVFHFMPITSCRFTGQHWKDPASVFPTPSHGVFIHINVLLERSLLQAFVRSSEKKIRRILTFSEL